MMPWSRTTDDALLAAALPGRVVRLGCRAWSRYSQRRGGDEVLAAACGDDSRRAARGPGRRDRGAPREAPHPGRPPRPALELDVLERNVATTAPFIPLAMALGRGREASIPCCSRITPCSKSGPRGQPPEGRELGRTVGQGRSVGPPLLLRFVGPLTCSGWGIGLARSPGAPEAASHVEEHFGRKLHAQNVAMAARMIELAREQGCSPTPALRELLARMSTATDASWSHAARSGWRRHVVASRARPWARPGLRPMRVLPTAGDPARALEKCVFCPKLCRSACPVSNAEPRETITPWGKMSMAWMAAHGDVPVDASHAAPAWACTGCFGCREACDHRNPVADVLFDARSALMSAGAPAPTPRNGSSRASEASTRHSPAKASHARCASDGEPRQRGAPLTLPEALLIGCSYLRGAPARGSRRDRRSPVRLLAAIR